MTYQKAKIDLDTKYANWNGWYHDTFEEIKVIRNIGGNLLLNPRDNIHKYYSALLNIYSTHSSYITNHEKIKKSLDTIKNKIYVDKFHEELKKEVFSKNIIDVISELVGIFTKMNTSFSTHGITPKVTETTKRDPGNALNEEY